MGKRDENGREEDRTPDTVADDDLILGELEDDVAGSDEEIDDEDDGIEPELVPFEGELEDEGDDVIGEDDDNPYEESDEALPDDDEERAIDISIKRAGERTDGA